MLGDPAMEQNEKGENSGNMVRFMPRGQVVRYKDGNWKMGQEASPTIQVCVMVVAQIRVAQWGGESGQSLSFKEFVVYIF